MTFIGANAAGLKNKKDSYLRLVKHFNPGAFFVQETKVRRKKCFEIDGYDSFEFIRTNSSGGGLLTLVHKSLDPVEVATESEQEILVVEASVGNMRVRLINAYGPQEYASEDTRIQFFTQLDLEVKKAKLSGALVLIEMDSNAKLGSKLIPSDPKPQSENGKLLENVISDNSLVIVNAQPFCTGSITRYRKTIRGEEKSILDHFLVCEEMFESVRSMSVDEAGCYALTKYSNKSGSRASVKESDHYTIFLELEHLWKPSESETGNRLEVYNFNDKESFDKFVSATSDNEKLRNCFDDKNEDLETSSKRWLNILNDLIKSSFKKIRIKKNKMKPELVKLFEKKEYLKLKISNLQKNKLR